MHGHPGCSVPLCSTEFHTIVLTATPPCKSRTRQVIETASGTHQTAQWVLHLEAVHASSVFNQDKVRSAVECARVEQGRHDHSGYGGQNAWTACIGEGAPVCPW